MSLGRAPWEKLDGGVDVEVESEVVVEDLLSFFTIVERRMKKTRAYRIFRNGGVAGVSMMLLNCTREDGDLGEVKMKVKVAGDQG